LHLVNELKQQVVDVRRCLLDISLTMSIKGSKLLFPVIKANQIKNAGLTIFVKRWCIISPTSFLSSAPTFRSFIFFSKLARESHKLPPAKLLRQNSTGRVSDFRLRLTFDVISLDPLSSDVFLPLSAWNFARVFINSESIHSANTVGERSNFLTLALHPYWPFL